MPNHVAFWMMEAAFRSLLMAVAVWGGIRLLRLQTVLAQKIAWALAPQNGFRGTGQFDPIPFRL
jgi:hypothetical protein